MRIGMDVISTYEDSEEETAVDLGNINIVGSGSLQALLAA